ncbi:hypothetical protein [Chitinophaga varians]
MLPAPVVVNPAPLCCGLPHQLPHV